MAAKTTAGESDETLLDVALRIDRAKNIVDRAPGAKDLLGAVPLAYARDMTVNELVALAAGLDANDLVVLRLVCSHDLRGLFRGGDGVESAGTVPPDGDRTTRADRLVQQPYRLEMSAQEKTVASVVHDALSADRTRFDGRRRFQGSSRRAELLPGTPPTVAALASYFVRFAGRIERLSSVTDIDLSECCLIGSDMASVFKVVDIIVGRHNANVTVRLNSNDLHGRDPKERLVLDKYVRALAGSPRIEAVDIAATPMASVDRADFFSTLTVSEFERLVFIREEHLDARGWTILVKDARLHALVDKVHHVYYGMLQ